MGVDLSLGGGIYFIFPTYLSNIVFNDQWSTEGSYSSGNMLKSSAKCVFMSGKDANNEVWHFESRRSQGDLQGNV